MTSSATTIAQVLNAAGLVRGWLARRVPSDVLDWIEQQASSIGAGERPLHLGIAFGLVPRKVGKNDLDLSVTEGDAGRATRDGLDTTGWSVDQAARIYLVLASFRGDEAAFFGGVDRIFSTAEIGEQIALLRGLPLFPAPQFFMARATEGVRSAMQPVFEAVAHRNPYPRDHFSTAQWNQMVVKTLFIGSRLAPVQGLDERRNADLARILVDYADERRAAGRSISPELWRCVAPFAGETEIAALATILGDGSDNEAAAAALALAESRAPSAAAALAARPDLAAAARDGRITWNTIA
jgi:hypothetical protein